MKKSVKQPRVSFEPFEHDILTNGGYKYSKNAPFSAQLSSNYLTKLIKQAVAGIQACTKIEKIADFGCGDGVYTYQLAKRFPQISFFGSDAAEHALKLAQANYPQINFYFWNMMKKSTSGDYDVAILRGVIHHLPNPEKGIRHAAQLCRYLIVVEPNGWSPILKVIEKVSPYHRQHWERSFTSQKIIHWCQNSQLLIVNQKFVGFVPFFCPSWLARTLKKIEPVVEKSWLAPILCAQVIQVYKRRTKS